MEDLYTRFNAELIEKVADLRKLLFYLADSYFGVEDDLIRIRVVYREFIDFKSYYTSRNKSALKPDQRAWRDDYQDEAALAGYMDAELKPIIGMIQFVIELYEENK